jgi:hypothetical protein
MPPSSPSRIAGAGKQLGRPSECRPRGPSVMGAGILSK